MFAAGLVVVRLDFTPNRRIICAFYWIDRNVHTEICFFGVQPLMMCLLRKSQFWYIDASKTLSRRGFALVLLTDLLFLMAPQKVIFGICSKELLLHIFFE